MTIYWLNLLTFSSANVEDREDGDMVEKMPWWNPDLAFMFWSFCFRISMETMSIWFIVCLKNVIIFEDILFLSTWTGGKRAVKYAFQEP